jgi:spore coat protein H
MRRFVQSFAVAVLAAAFAFAPSATAASYAKKEKRAPGEEIFDNKTVLPLRIEISSNELARLRRNDRQDVRATVWEGSNVWHNVALHVKGAAGSRRVIDDAKPALTLRFNEFTPDQKFHGLRKIHLNNSVQDASYMCENICGELFRKVGVPAARVSYATLELNGKKRGLYVLKEGFTKDLLGIYFKNTKGNLYDGGFLREVSEQLERDLGGDDDVKDWSDLKALAKAAQEPDAEKRWEELNRVLDVERFFKFMALEVMTWDWDGYFMNRNNYRVYHDLDTGKMVFFPHGMDQMFWEPTRPILPQDKINSSLVGRAVLTTPAGKKIYREYFGEVFTNIFQVEVLTNRVNELAALLKPHVGSDHEGHVKTIRDRIAARHKSLALALTLPEPEPLKFQSGVAKLVEWELPADIQALQEKGECRRGRVNIDGRHSLYIQTSELSAGSWRTRVMLDPGVYRFEALVKTADVAGVEDPKKGEGAGVRHSGTQFARDNKLVGTSDWELLTHTFSVTPGNDTVYLLCELRAAAGEAWFDVDSLKLVKVK